MIALIARTFIVRYYHKWEFGPTLSSDLFIGLIALIVRTFIVRYYHKWGFGPTLMSIQCQPGWSKFRHMVIYKNASHKLLFVYKFKLQWLPSAKYKVHVYIYTKNKKWRKVFIGAMNRRKMTCPLKYLAKGSKSPYPGSEKIPCKYSARGAKSQPRFSLSADQGRLPSNFFVAGKVFRNI